MDENTHIDTADLRVFEERMNFHYYFEINKQRNK